MVALICTHVCHGWGGRGGWGRLGADGADGGGWGGWGGGHGRWNGGFGNGIAIPLGRVNQGIPIQQYVAALQANPLFLLQALGACEF